MAVILMFVLLAGGVSMSQGKLYKPFYHKTITFEKWQLRSLVDDDSF